MLVSQSTMALAAGTPVPRTSARLVRVIGACAPMRCRAINCPSGIPLPAQATGLAPTAARRRLNSHATSYAVTTTVVATTLARCSGTRVGAGRRRSGARFNHHHQPVRRWFGGAQAGRMTCSPVSGATRIARQRIARGPQLCSAALEPQHDKKKYRNGCGRGPSCRMRSRDRRPPDSPLNKQKRSGAVRDRLTSPICEWSGCYRSNSLAVRIKNRQGGAGYITLGAAQVA